MPKFLTKKLFLFFLVAVALVFSFKPGVLGLARWTLKKHFVLDDLNIGDIEIRSYRQIAFVNIRARKGKTWFFEAQEVRLFLKFSNSFLKNALRLGIKSARLEIKNSTQTVSDFFKEEFSENAPEPLLSRLDCQGIDVTTQFKDLNLAGRFSINVDIASRQVHSLYLDVSVVDYKKFHLENLLLVAGRGDRLGHLSIAKVQYDKMVVEELVGPARFENKNLVFDHLSAKVLNGNVTGDFMVSFVTLAVYQTKLRFYGLDIERFVKDFDLENKLTMTGSLSGSIFAEGRGSVLKVFGGDLVMDAPGGRLTIKDSRVLRDIAERSPLANDQGNLYQTSVDAVVESLQDYNYNSGRVGLSLRERDFFAEINLDGKQGKRNFNIILHH